MVRVIVLAAARGVSQQNPVGGAVTSPAKACGIDKGFHKIDRMLVELFPILRQPLRHATEKVRGQVRYLDPRQNQKACVVGQEADVPPPRFRAPTKEAVAAAQVTRR